MKIIGFMLFLAELPSVSAATFQVDSLALPDSDDDDDADMLESENSASDSENEDSRMEATADVTVP